jgi:hypothetical protein
VEHFLWVTWVSADLCTKSDDIAGCPGGTRLRAVANNLRAEQLGSALESGPEA